jgi:peptidoglycan glycosyltransferase
MNRATQGFYPPGSTFKVLMAALAIDAGFSGTLYCQADGYTTSSHYRKIRDHEYYSARRAGKRWEGFGNLDLATALAKSSNVFFAQLGVRYGHEAFERNAERFLFGHQIRLYPGTDRTGAISTGRVPRIAESDLYGLAQASIGQGKMMATPAHMATIAAAVANQGIAMQPRLMAGDPPTVLARYMPAGTAQRLARMMRRVVTDGTGRGIDRDDLAIAGKTGTAENPHGKSHSWFIGFAPAGRPALAVAVLVEQGGFGSQTAAPIARDLFLRARDLGLFR